MYYDEIQIKKKKRRGDRSLLTKKKTRQARDGTVKDKTTQLLSIHLLLLLGYNLYFF